MQVLISTEASNFLRIPVTSHGTNQAMGELIKHRLDRLRKNQYLLCKKGAAFAVSTFEGTPLALYYNDRDNLAILFHSPGKIMSLQEDFFQDLVAACTEFHLL